MNSQHLLIFALCFFFTLPAQAKLPVSPMEFEPLISKTWLENKQRFKDLVSNVAVSQNQLDTVAAEASNHKNTWQTHLKLGAIYEQKGLINFASQEYQLAHELSKGDTLPLCNLIRWKLQIGSAKESLQLAEDGALSFPKEPLFWSIRCQILLNGFQLNDAHEIAQQAIHIFPHQPEFWQLDILSLAPRGKEEILVAAKEATRLFPRNAQTHAAYALALLSRQKSKEALTECNVSLVLDPTCHQAYKLKMHALQRLGQYANVLTCYTEAFRKLPLEQQFTQQYLTTLVKAGRFTEAIEPALVLLSGVFNPYEKETANDESKSMMSPQDKTEHYIRLLAGAVLLVTPEDKANESIKQATQRLTHSTSQLQVYCVAADLYDKLGRFESAFRHLKTASNLLPQNWRTHLLLAQYLEANNLNYYAALNGFKKVLSLRSADHNLAQHVAVLSGRINNRTNDIAWQAKDSLRKAMFDNPLVAAVSFVQKEKNDRHLPDTFETLQRIALNGATPQ